MAREALIRLPENEADKSPFKFILLSSAREIGRDITIILTSNIGKIPDSFRIEFQTNLSISESIPIVQETFRELSERVLERYPDGHQAHKQAEDFLADVSLSISRFNQN